MLRKEEPVGPHGIMGLIANLSAQAASGRLEIVASGIEGDLTFNDGKLVDARIGHLTGFQAINALASMRDARFHFDPSVAVPAISSITPSERRVLKQFFGIETADAKDHSVPAVVQPVDETTVIKSSVGSEPTSDVILEPTSDIAAEPLETAAIYHARPKVRYIAAFALGVLLIAVAAAAMLLREKFRERSSAPAVAAGTESASPTAPVEPGVTEEARVTEAPRRIDEPRVHKEFPRVTEEPRVSEKSSAATPDLTGEWKVVNTVNTTSYRSFQNLQIGFALSINQTGTTFTARGTKVSENGRRLPAGSRSPIELKGVIKGDRIEATFSEQGAMRKTNGRFVWKIDPAGGGLTGTFASTAARTSGKSTATREL